jgi:glycosyltransferase involved in cell wall biosynthesis
MASKIAGIICTHNRHHYLEGAIESLLAQTCPDCEILVVDNASTDKTRQVVESRLGRWAAKIRLRTYFRAIYRQKSRGEGN